MSLCNIRYVHYFFIGYFYTNVRTDQIKFTFIHSYLDCVIASSVNMFKNKVDIYLRRAVYTKMKKGWTLDKPMTCHLGLCLGWQSC